MWFALGWLGFELSWLGFELSWLGFMLGPRGLLNTNCNMLVSGMQNACDWGSTYWGSNVKPQLKRVHSLVECRRYYLYLSILQVCNPISHVSFCCPCLFHITISEDIKIERVQTLFLAASFNILECKCPT